MAHGRHARPWGQEMLEHGPSCRVVAGTVAGGASGVQDRFYPTADAIRRLRLAGPDRLNNREHMVGAHVATGTVPITGNAYAVRVERHCAR